MKKQTKLWLYLTRRDGKDVRILTVLSGHEQPPVRISDPSILQLNAANQAEVERIISENRMMWEPWLESADSYDSFKTNLRKRGFSRTPLNGKPEVFNSTFVNTSGLPKKKTMLRKKT